MMRAHRRASNAGNPGTSGIADRRLTSRRGLHGMAAIVLAAGLTSGLAACGDDDEDLDDVDVDVTTDMGTDDTGMAPGTTMTGGTGDMGGSGDSATVPTPVSGSVSNDDGGSDATSAP